MATATFRTTRTILFPSLLVSRRRFDLYSRLFCAPLSVSFSLFVSPRLSHVFHSPLSLQSHRPVDHVAFVRCVRLCMSCNWNEQQRYFSIFVVFIINFACDRVWCEDVGPSERKSVRALTFEQLVELVYRWTLCVSLRPLLCDLLSMKFHRNQYVFFSRFVSL